MSDVLTTDVVSFQTGQRSILSKVRNAGLVRPDANTSLFAAGGLEHVLLHIEVNEQSRTHRITHRMTQAELSAVEQNARLAVFHQNSAVLARCPIREHQRLARDAGSQGYWTLQVDLK